jgi:predicted RNase H-like HicB family nuclease
MMMKTPKEILQRPYSRVLVPEEDGRFSASILEFSGCFSSGDSAAQAYANLEEAATSWVEAALDQKIDIPGPLADQRAGGRLLLRLPRSLHQRLMALAERDGVSLNQYVVAALAERVGAVTTGARLVSEAQKLVRGVTQVLRAATVRLTSFCRKKPHAR